MSESDMNTTQYCAIADVKDRLLIKASDNSYNTSITNAIIEASRTLDIFLKPYVTVPLSSTIPDPLIIICADLSASTFKRRLVPTEVKIRGSMQPDMINDIDGTGWFALAIKKLQEYIKSYYALAQPIGNTVYNSEIYSELFKKGLITLKEARAFMHLATVVAKNTENNEVINRAMNEAIAQAVTKILYITKKQNSFGFIRGNSSADNVGAGYLKESE